MKLSELQLLSAFIYYLVCKWSKSIGIITCQISRLSTELHCFSEDGECVKRARGLFGCPFCCLLSCVAGTWWKVCGELPAAEVIIVWVSSKMWPWSYFPWSRHSKQTHNHDSTLCGLDWSCCYSFKKMYLNLFWQPRMWVQTNPPVQYWALNTTLSSRDGIFYTANLQQ